MASSTNQLTIVLGVADAKLREGIRKAQRHLRGLEGGLNRAGTAGTAAGAKINAGAKTAALGLNTARKSVARFSEAVRSSVVNLRFLAGMFVGGALTRGVVRFASSFEKSLAEINTLLFNSAQTAEEFGVQLKGLAATTPKDLLDLSASLYQIISAGVPAGQAMEVLAQSTKLAVSSLSETKDASNLLITTLNAYKQTGLDAATATDKLTRIYQLGRTRVTEMSRAFGRGAPLAAQFGVTIDELGGLLISLTRAGLNTNESLTAIRAIMSGIAKPTLKTRKLLKELNVAFGQGAIDARGFTGVLESLLRATGGNVDVMARLFPNIRALLPAVITVGAGFDEFRGHVDAVKNSFGATDEALAKTDDKFFKSAALLKSNFQNALVEMGDQVLPVLQEKLDTLSDWFKSDEGGEFAQTLGKLIRAMIEITAVVTRFIASGLKTAVNFFEKNSASIGVLIKALLALKAASIVASNSLRLFGAMGLLAGKSWVAGLKASFASQRLAMLGVNTANMTTAQMAAAFKSQSAVARIGSAIAVGLRSALSVAMSAVMAAGIIALLISTIYDQFFGEAERQANERSAKLRKKMEKERAETLKLIERLERERTGATPEQLEKLRERQKSGTVIKLDRREQRDLIELGAFQPFDLAKEAQQYVEARQLYQKILGAFAAKLGDQASTDEGMQKAREQATARVQAILEPRIKTLNATIKSQFESVDNAADTIQSSLLGKVERLKKGGNVWADDWFDLDRSNQKPLERIIQLYDIQIAEVRKRVEEAKEAAKLDRPLGREDQDREDKLKFGERTSDSGPELPKIDTRLFGGKAKEQAESLIADLVRVREGLELVSGAGPEAEKAMIEAFQSFKKIPGGPDLSTGMLALDAKVLTDKLKDLPQEIRSLVISTRIQMANFDSLFDKGRLETAIAPLSDVYKDGFLARLNRLSTDLKARVGPLATELSDILIAIDKQAQNLVRQWQEKQERGLIDKKQLARRIIKVEEMRKEVRRAVLEGGAVQDIQRTAMNISGDPNIYGRIPKGPDGKPIVSEITFQQTSSATEELFRPAIGDDPDFSRFRGLQGGDADRLLKVRQLLQGVADVARAANRARAKGVKESDHQRRMMTRIIALARQLNVVIDDGTEKTVKRTNSLIGFIQNLFAANKAQKKLTKTTGGAGRDFRRSFNKAIARLIDRTEKQRIKNSVTLAKLQVARNRNAAAEYANLAKSAQLGRSWYGEQSQLLREVTGSLRSQQEIILAGLDIQREATRQQIIAAKAEQERAIARERTRLKELLRGNAASGARGKKNRIRMENALANFRVQKERETANKIAKLNLNLDKRLQDSSRKAAAIDLKIVDLQVKEIDGRISRIRDELSAIGSQIKTAESRLKNTGSIEGFIREQRRLLELKDKEAAKNREILRAEKRRQEQIRGGAEFTEALPFLDNLKSNLAKRKKLLAEAEAVQVEPGGSFTARRDNRDSLIRLRKADVDEFKFYVAEYQKGLDQIKKRREAAVAEGTAVIDEKALAKSAKTIRQIKSELENVDKAAARIRIVKALKTLEGLDFGLSENWSRVSGSLKEAEKNAELLGDRIETLPFHTRKAIEQAGLLSSDLLETKLIAEQLFRAFKKVGELPRLGNLSVEILKTFTQFIQDVPARLAKASVEFAAELTAQLGNIGVGDFSFITDAAMKFAAQATRPLIDGIDLVGSRLGMTLGKTLSGVMSEAGGQAGKFFGETAGTWFGVAVSSVLDGALRAVSSMVISPITSAVQKPFSLLTSGISEAFESLTKEGTLSEQAFNERIDRLNREHDLRIDHIYEEANQAAQKIDDDLAKTQDINKIKELTAKREEIRAKRDEELLAARRDFAKQEMEEREKNKGPENIVEEYINKALELVNTLVDRLPDLAVSAVQSLTEHLPTIIVGAANALAETLSAIAPIIGDLIVSVVQGILDSMPQLIKAAGEFVIGLVEGIIEAFLLILNDFDKIAGPLIEAIARGAPKILAAVIKALPKLVGATIKMIPMFLIELAKGLGLLIKGIFVDAGEALLEVVSFGVYSPDGEGNFLSGALGGAALGAGITAGLGYVSTFGAAAALTTPLGLGIIGGAALLGGIGSALDWWHSGGNIKEGNRNPVGARLLAGLGARGYATGGLVSGIQNSINGSRLRSLRRGVDDVPAVLQAGEAVLNRAAVTNLGEETINALNSGTQIDQGPTNVNVSINPDPGGLNRVVSQLLPHLISGVNAEVDRPGSQLRIDTMRQGGRPIGTMRPRRG